MSDPTLDYKSLMEWVMSILLIINLVNYGYLSYKFESHCFTCSWHWLDMCWMNKRIHDCRKSCSCTVLWGWTCVVCLQIVLQSHLQKYLLPSPLQKAIRKKCSLYKNCLLYKWKYNGKWLNIQICHIEMKNIQKWGYEGQ